MPVLIVFPASILNPEYCILLDHCLSLMQDSAVSNMQLNKHW